MADTWWDTSYKRRVPLPVKGTLPLITGDLTDFPCATILTDAALGWDAAGDAQAKADGSDVVFVNQAGDAVLDFELDKWARAGTSCFHFRMPTITDGVDSLVYAYWANAAASSQANATGVWDGATVARWALESAASPLADSVGAYTGSNHGADAATGKLGGGLDFIGTNSDYADFGDITELNSAAAFTVSGWFNPDALDVNGDWFRKYQATNSNILLFTSNDGNLYVRIRNGVSVHGYFDYSTAISAGTWSHVALVYNGAGAANADRLKVCVNGADQALTFVGSIPATTADLSGIPFQLSAAAVTFDGLQDDLRVALTNRSESWCAAEFYSGDAQLVTVGTVETQAVAPPPGPVTFTDATERVVFRDATERVTYTDATEQVRYRAV